jgi:hypothetical protein
MRNIAFHQRVLFALCFALPLGFAITSPAQASWSGGASGITSAEAFTMPSGAQPIASASGKNVTIRWPAEYFPDNQSVAGYIVYRVNAATGVQAAAGASCSGTIAATTCTDLNVPSGTWTYTDTPVQDSWSGGQSLPSRPITLP